MRTALYLIFCLITGSLCAQTDGENLFDDTFLHEIRITNVDTLFYIDTKDYQMGSVEIDGVSLPDIGFKRKGNISGYISTNKFPIKIKTNKYIMEQEYDGIKEFMLHMNYQDPTQMREKLTYDICSELGLFALRSAFAKVYINDVYWGLYTIVEGKDEMYKQLLDNRDADAMESTEFGNMCYNGANTSDYYSELFEDFYYTFENGDETTAWNRFIQMLDKVNNTPNATYIDIAGQDLNLEDFFKLQAINVYLLNRDSYIGFTGNQIYVYDEANSIWQVVPWDFNASFGLWDTNNHTVTDYPILPGFSCFGGKIEEIPALKNYYLDAMCQLINQVCDTTTMFNRIDFLSAQIQDAVFLDGRKNISNQDFENGIEFGYFDLFGENQPALKTVIRERFNLIKAELEALNYTCPDISDNVSEAALVETFFYPNPTADRLSFKGKMTDLSAVKLMNCQGQTVLESDCEDNTIDVSSLSSGMYQLIWKVGNVYHSQKIIKQ